MMKTLAATIEAKDDYMRGHSYRVAEYSALIAKQLGWSEHDVEILEMLHICMISERLACLILY